MRSLLIAPQTTYNEKHWEPHQNQAMAEAVGEVAEFESKHDLNKLVSHTCSEMHTHIRVIVCSHYAHMFHSMWCRLLCEYSSPVNNHFISFHTAFLTCSSTSYHATTN